MLVAHVTRQDYDCTCFETNAVCQSDSPEKSGNKMQIYHRSSFCLHSEYVRLSANPLYHFFFSLEWVAHTAEAKMIVMKEIETKSKQVKGDRKNMNKK